MFGDGWVAFARFDPYRVDWCPPSGRCTPGAVIEERPPYTAADKRVYLEMMARRYPEWPTDPDRNTGWPPTVPPFVADVVNVTGPAFPMPDGRLMIARLPTTRTPANSYDVIDRRGNRVGTLLLNAAQRVVGFGSRSIYVATIDSNDIERLQRHPWP
jgi:hypothetical protein